MISRRYLFKIVLAGFVANLVPPMVNMPPVQATGWRSDALRVGDVITIEGKFAFNPQTREPTSYLREFIITAVTTSGDFELRPR